MTRILLAEDHFLVREGVKLLFSLEPDLEVVGETGDGAIVEQMVADIRPDLLLLDLHLPGCHGNEIAVRIKSRFDAVKILVLTGSLQADAVHQALAAGADGYVIKQEDGAELLQAVRAVLAGRQYVSKSIAAAFRQERAHDAPAEQITPREQEILCLIARGLSNEVIAETLCRSLFTVRKHRQNLMDKLGLRNAAEITAYAIKHGFYEPA
jgi:DNA-binding NarL/FixJ family response regulator